MDWLEKGAAYDIGVRGIPLQPIFQILYVTLGSAVRRILVPP